MGDDVESSLKLSDKAVQKLLAKVAPILNPDENVRFVGQCLNILPALSHFLITDTRVIGVEQASVRFAHHGSDIERIDYDLPKGRITLKARGTEPFTMKSVEQGDFPTIEANFQRLQARTAPADGSAPGSSPAPEAPAAPAETPSAAPPSAAPSPRSTAPAGDPPPPASPDDAPPPTGVYSYDVVLTATGGTPISLIKEVRSLTSLDLATAKKLVEGPPWTIIERADATSAEAAKARLEKAGAVIELIASTEPPLSPPSGPPAAVATSSTSTVPAGQQHCGGSLSGAAGRAIAEVSHSGEIPWLILNPAGATGVLVAFEDRLAIIKTGAFTGFMAGSMFGGRQAVLYFVDINGIEFNAGMVNGVLEILTASYQGSANKDFWQGTLSSRNADSNDPFTLSNTLPMLKSEYREWQKQISELRSRIAAAKRPAAPASVVAPAPDSFADQVAKLAQLRADGLLSDDEFKAAKQKLMDG